MLNKKVEQWFYDRDMQELDPDIQLLKLYEEFGELSEAIVKNNVLQILDAIGDMGVVLRGVNIMRGKDHAPKPIQYDYVNIYGVMHSLSLEIGKFSTMRDKEHHCDRIAGLLDNIARRYDSTYYECLNLAYDEIKDRKGKVVNGVFVKEDDLDGVNQQT